MFVLYLSTPISVGDLAFNSYAIRLVAFLTRSRVYDCTTLPVYWIAPVVRYTGCIPSQHILLGHRFRHLTHCHDHRSCCLTIRRGGRTQQVRRSNWTPPPPHLYPNTLALLRWFFLSFIGNCFFISGHNVVMLLPHFRVSILFLFFLFVFYPERLPSNTVQSSRKMVDRMAAVQDVKDVWGNQVGGR